MIFWTRRRLVALAVLVIVVGYAASPYWMLWRLQRAAERNDLAVVEELIDFPTVRTAMKGKASEAVRSKLAGVMDNKIVAGLLGNAIGPEVLNRLIDEQITPTMAARLIQGAQIEHAWFSSPRRFNFESRGLKATAGFRGFGWRVIWIGLPGEG